MQYLKANVSSPAAFISCGHFSSNVPWTHSKRCIDSYEIIIGVDKSLYLSQDEIKYVVNPGDVLLLKPGSVHEGYEACEAGVSFYWLHFFPNTGTFIDEKALAEELSNLTIPDSPATYTDVYLPIFCEPRSIERVNILFQQLQHVANSNSYTQLAGHYLATSLLIELSEQMIVQYSVSREKSQGDRNLAQIIEWIRIHALEDISTTDIASAFSYNKDYLSRFFRQKTGYHLQEYINLMKIAKAKDMLSRGTRNIKYVSYKVGIRDEKYFMRLFKKYVNMTPTEYRQAYYKLHMNNH